MENRFLYRAYIKSKKITINLIWFHFINDNKTILLSSKENGFEIYVVSDVVLMQCTGLKDKDGKLIYEGDIVKCLSNIAVITWESGCFWYGVSELSYGFTQPEIIGNIYENPELHSEN